MSRAAIIVLGLIIWLVSPPAISDDKEISEQWWAGKRFSLRFGAFRPSLKTNVRLDGAGGQGTEIEVESVLNHKDSLITPVFDMSYRFNRRHSLQMAIFQLGRKGTQTLESTIRFGDREFQIGTEVQSEFEVQIYQLNYGYSFFADKRKNFGIAAGFYIQDSEATIFESGTSSGETGKFTAPLPLIGLYGVYALTPKWIFTGKLQYFALSVDPVDGTWQNFFVGFQHNTFKRVSIGGGWYNFSLDVAVNDEGYKGIVDFDYGGPALLIGVHF